MDPSTTYIKALLALEDGRTFGCRSFTGHGEVGGEVVFNTAMSGYQEVLTDPSYSGQLVTMTYPLIGNYGVNPEDVESRKVQVAAFLIKEYQPFPSNFRSTATLASLLTEQNILGVEQVDTRALTRHIRTAGALRACISTRELDPDALVARARSIPGMQGQALVDEVTTHSAYRWVDGAPAPCADLDTGVWRHAGRKHRVAAFDFGIKYNIIRLLEAAGCEVVVVPAQTTADTIKAMAPDGIFLSNGPGDPEPLTHVVKTMRSLLDYRPIFGICLGIQILGLCLGGTTYKLKFGHRGGNQPVKNLLTGRVEITSQNHGFVVDADSLDADAVEITHINLNDNTLEGFRHRYLPVFAVQYHPEASPGPHDAGYLFDTFTTLMENR